MAAFIPPADPLLTSQWYVTNNPGPDLNLTGIWPDYNGAGITIALIDDGFDTAHPDLAGRFDARLSYDLKDGDSDIRPAAGQYHGTAVAGILGAAANASGIVGISYGSSLMGLRISFGDDGTEDMFAAAFQRARAADIINNSWGYVEPFSDIFTASYFASFRTALIDAARLGRGGLGSVIVFSAGNSALSGDNTNYHNVQNAPYAITVASVDSLGNHSAFSNPGASILVSAPGAGVLTLDATGSAGTVPGDYINGVGTSFAAPMVSGVVALMLQANPELGYRDVQEILAYSARKTGTGGEWQVNGANNWNGGGLHYSHLYGFGMTDAHAAVRLAETWTLSHTYDNQVTLTQTANTSVAIPDTGTVASFLTITQDLIVDHVEVTIDITHANAAQLRIVLISPDGTQSILADHAPMAIEFPTFTFSTVASWGENARGTWTLQITDTVAGIAGSLNAWTLHALGDTPSADDTYIYTDENTGLIRPVDDDGGNDTINAAAITRGLSHTLQAGIENLYTGDGADFLAGNAGDNTIVSGRGNDTIRASGGNDVIDGGTGTDTYLSDQVFNASVSVNGTGDITLTSLDDGTITRLKNIERFSFAGMSYDMPGIAAASRSGTLTDVIYFVHGAAGVAQRHSATAGNDAFTAQDLNVGGQGIVLLSEREFDHLTLTNNAGANLNAVSMRMDDGLHLTLRGFGQVTLVADGSHATSIEIAGGQRGFIQTGSGDDTVDFLAFLIDRHAPAQERTLTAHTGAGNDRVTITDRSDYLAYDIDLGAGNDVFTAQGTQGGHILGGTGADTFIFGQNNGQNTGIYDFSAAEGDRLDLSGLLEEANDPVASYIQLVTANNNTTVKVQNTEVATLYGTSLTDSVQHYIDIGLLVTRD